MICGTGAEGSGLQVIHLQADPCSKDAPVPVPKEELEGGEEGLPAEPVL